MKVNIKKSSTYRKDKETPVLLGTVFKINIQMFLVDRLKYIFVIVKKHLTNKKFIFTL